MTECHIWSLGRLTDTSDMGHWTSQHLTAGDGTGIYWFENSLLKFFSLKNQIHLNGYCGSGAGAGGGAGVGGGAGGGSGGGLDDRPAGGSEEAGGRS